jgi:predicted nucleic acid-binding protein
MAKKIILCDTGILIQLFRGDENIKAVLSNIGIENLAISVITTAEILYGMRKHEEQKTKTLLRKFKQYHLNKPISEKFIELMNDQNLPGLQIPDALIAASCLANHLPLYTLNKKDFSGIPGLELYHPK